VGRITFKTQLLQCSPNAQVAGKEHVRIPQRTHAYVRGGPRTDPFELQELAFCLIAVDPRIELYVTRSDRSS
jgi:hypothetical protein